MSQQPHCNNGLICNPGVQEIKKNKSLVQNAGWIKGEGVFILYNIWELERKSEFQIVNMGLKPRALTLVNSLGRVLGLRLGFACGWPVIVPWAGSGMLDASEGCKDAELHQQTLWRGALGPVKVLEPCQILENLLSLSAAAVERFP